MSQFNTGICQCGISTPQVALNSYQGTVNQQNLTNWIYVSTVQAATPNYVYKYKSHAERLQALSGRLNLGQCG
jgi:hypothetical protein